ncbi:hypothetical protein GGR57DRAFT_502440 [Xylariaceae sp. FL1272]|nr:hypothetical protein GGR57DRAFT_502440 [Xylariaceae sp. FL1272]
MISNLPPELLLRVGEQLAVADCCSLSSVNSHFRRFLLPTLFKCLRANNRYEHAETFQKLVPEIATYVQRLEFDLYLHQGSGEDDVDEEGGGRRPSKAGRSNGVRTLKVSDTAPIVWELLSRRALPNLSTLRVTFCPLPEDFRGDGWSDDGLGGSIYLAQDVEDEDDIAEAEMRFYWRGLFNRSFETMASGSGDLHRLEILNLPPKSASALWTDEWKTFLGTVKEFKISLWGGDNGAGWHANTLEGYLEWISDLEESFFEHLTSAERVKLVAHDQNPIGCPGMRQCPIPFGPGHMPRIEHLELQDCFVDAALIAFLSSHPQQLRSLRLTNCYSAGNNQARGTARSATPWSVFFSAVRRSQADLHEFILQEGRTPPLTHEEQFEDDDVPYEPPDDEADDVKTVRRILSEDTGRRLFAYACLDDKYGMVFAYEEVNISAFLEGTDQREFDELMAMVKRNQIGTGRH